MPPIRQRNGVFSILLVAAFAGGCTGPDEEFADLCRRAPAEVDDTGDHRYYVVDRVELPRTATESHRFGRDLDCDDQQRPDNALGQILPFLHEIGADGGYDLTAEAQALVDAGQILHLIDVQASSLGSADGVGGTIAHAADTDTDPTDNFSGSEPLSIRADRPVGYLTGSIHDGVLQLDLGTAPIAITFPGLDEPFILELKAARIDAVIDAGGMEGTFAGVLTVEEVQTKLIPILRAGLSRLVERDCDLSGCIPGSAGEDLLGELDWNRDGVLADEELRQSPLISAVLAPDLDLFHGESYELGADGTKDSLSVGIGFSAVPAVLVD